jgi:hypothetical protein
MHPPRAGAGRLRWPVDCKAAHGNSEGLLLDRACFQRQDCMMCYSAAVEVHVPSGKAFQRILTERPRTIGARLHLGTRYLIQNMT